MEIVVNLLLRPLPQDIAPYELKFSEVGNRNEYELGRVFRIPTAFSSRQLLLGNPAGMMRRAISIPR
jgi:hypothetical protein